MGSVVRFRIRRWYGRLHSSLLEPFRAEKCVKPRMTSRTRQPRAAIPSRHDARTRPFDTMKHSSARVRLPPRNSAGPHRVETEAGSVAIRVRIPRLERFPTHRGSATSHESTEERLESARDTDCRRRSGRARGQKVPRGRLPDFDRLRTSRSAPAPQVSEGDVAAPTQVRDVGGFQSRSSA
jgi:hypothetical protein